MARDAAGRRSGSHRGRGQLVGGRFRAAASARRRLTPAEDTCCGAASRGPVSVQADFLYGAPGSGLAVEGEGPAHRSIRIRSPKFARLHVRPFRRELRRANVPAAGHGDGRHRRGDLICLQLPTTPETSMPLRARIVAGVADPGGRHGARKLHRRRCAGRTFIIGLKAARSRTAAPVPGERVAFGGRDLPSTADGVAPCIAACNGRSCAKTGTTIGISTAARGAGAAPGATSRSMALP